MTERGPLSLTVGSEDVDAVVLGFRLDGELHILGERAPPEESTISAEVTDGGE